MRRWLHNEVYCDASGCGNLAVFLNGKVTRLRSRSRNVNELEFQAISEAVRLYGNEYPIHSDNLNAIEKARKVYPYTNISWVKGSKNPADPYTQY